MKKTLATLALVLFLTPSLAFAGSGISHSQAESIILVLVAFGVDQATIDNVRGILEPVAVDGGTTTTTVTTGTPDQNWTVTVGPTPVPGNIQPTPTPAPVVPSIPMDTTASYTTLFTVEPIDDQGGVLGLRVTTNEVLDFPATVLPSGITIGAITFNGSSNGTSKFGPNKTLQKAYYYEALLNGVTPGTYDITIKDFAGNGTTRTVVVR